ncbi:hypothetical protein GCM10008024_40700 [Allgaiera indica]|uniref:Uncharacterized protein n=1 Tax=Allgaiera indica TaxID=765699 RepID=A0AAN4UWS0_9RHOB|nr:hypothetical protein GCM10008024_40700 [Allgaiera indica]
MRGIQSRARGAQVFARKGGGPPCDPPEYLDQDEGEEGAGRGGGWGGAWGGQQEGRRRDAALPVPGGEDHSFQDLISVS